MQEKILGEVISLVKKTMALTDNQLKAVRSESNTVITAGAGSGKTTVLAERFFWLVKEKRTPLDSILTLTFTRKAAAEMYERIYLRLSLDLRENEDDFIRDQIRQFDKSQISTLDSFCLTVAKNCPEMFGLPKGFALAPENAEDLLREFCLEFILKRHKEPVFTELIKGRTFESVLTQFLLPLSMHYIHLAEVRDFPAMYRRQREVLIKKNEEVTGQFLELCAKILAMPAEASKAIRDSRDLITAFLPSIDALILEEGYNYLKLKKPGGRTNAALDEFKGVIDSYNACLKELESLRKTLASGDSLKGFFLLLAEFQEACLKEKRRQGLVTFQDLQEMAVMVLKKNRELRSHYKKTFQYILIDEFQDNNDLQKRLLFLLAEKPELFKEDPGPEDLSEGKLFFVGDEKQSIYQFRGADVSVFKSLGREIGAAGGLSLPLSVNYRSEPGIIDFVNRLFRNILGESSAPYEASFIPLEPSHARLAGKPEIRLLFKPYNKEKSADVLTSDETEAYTVAKLIHDEVTNKTLPVRDNETIRPAEYPDFALLMRSTSSQVIYERMFRKFGIPYTTQQARTLFLEAPFNDMYNILRIAVYPGDRASYAAFLRSPFAGVSDAGIVKILAAREETAFAGRAEDWGLTPEDRLKFEKGMELFESASALADKITLKELVFHLWYTRGYRYHLLKNESSHPYLDYYDYLSLLAEKADDNGLCTAGFLDFLQENLGKYERLEDLEPLKEASQGVRIMSIHRAKGLQFPVVILANTGNMGRNENRAKAPFYISRDLGLTIQPDKRENYFYLLCEREAEEKETAEIKRLLYVALTRTQFHLFISGCHNSKNRNDESCHINMIAGALGLILEPGFARDRQDSGYTLSEIGDIPSGSLARVRTSYAAPDIERLLPLYEKKPVFSWVVPGPDATATSLNLSYLDENAGEPSSGDASEAEAFGNLCHFIMEKLLHNSYEPAGVPENLLAPFSKARGEKLLAEAETLCRRAAGSTLKDLLDRSVSAETEVPFLYCHRGGARPVFINGRMDLLVETAEEVCVIDYKTDKIIHRGAYDMQLSVYAAAAGDLCAKPAKAFLCYLRSGELVPIGLKDPAAWFSGKAGT
ncbi:MAG: hypothetical protein E4H36_07735 [Spirochaetales bacterium]|nr:MAG: hypothetical protein E4H36_07735 [Spirochaetales bacterium]